MAIVTVYLMEKLNKKKNQDTCFVFVDAKKRKEKENPSLDFKLDALGYGHPVISVFLSSRKDPSLQHENIQTNIRCLE